MCYFGLWFTACGPAVPDVFDSSLSRVYDDDEEANADVGDSEQLDAWFLGVAMGWS